MQSITKVFSDIVKPYIDAGDENLQNQLNINGAVNMVNPTGITQVLSGVQFTKNENGTISISRVSANTGIAYYAVGEFILEAGTYKLTNGHDGLPSGVHATYLYNVTDSAYLTNCNDGPHIFSLAAKKTIRYQIEVQSGDNPSGVIIYPMITVESYEGEYVPYAMSNKELTDEVTRLDGEAVKIVDSGLIDINSSHSFTCTNYEGYRLSIYSIGTDSIGSIVLFGKHSSVNIVKYSKFDCVNQRTDAPQISVSGSTLTITTTIQNCYYIIERIRNT